MSNDRRPFPPLRLKGHKGVVILLESGVRHKLENNKNLFTSPTAIGGMNSARSQTMALGWMAAKTNHGLAGDAFANVMVLKDLYRMNCSRCVSCATDVHNNGNRCSVNLIYKR